ncbi:sulfatase-like hydrolase/transferase [bacterium]|nr:sulfatase-like hydrolase/transferase [bacterium]
MLFPFLFWGFFMRQYCMLCLVACFCVFNAALLEASEELPNFVVILSDDQSWVGSSVLMDPSNPETRSDYLRTPQMERMSRMGMRFTQGYAPAPYCCPTRRSLVVGQTPARHVYQKDQPGWAKSFRESLSLPRMLKLADPSYRTAHFGKWDSRFDNVTPEQMGYDVSDGLTGNGTGGGKGDKDAGASDDPKLVGSLTKRVEDFIEGHAKSGQPFFVQVSHYAVHLDIFYRNSTLKRTRQWKPGRRHSLPKFAAMTSDVDQAVGQLLDHIDSLGLLGNTYIFFMSDNGGRLTMPGQNRGVLPRNYPLHEGKGSMYEGGLRVPFMVIGPGIEAGTTSRVPVTGLDVFPTIAEFAGFDGVLPEVLDGGSMVSVLRGAGQGKVQRSHPFLVFHQAGAREAQSALRQGDYKIVKHWAANRVELFNLADDLSEHRDLAAQYQQKCDEMEQSLDQFLEDVGALTERNTTKAGQRAMFSKSAP